MTLSSLILQLNMMENSDDNYTSTSITQICRSHVDPKLIYCEYFCSLGTTALDDGGLKYDSIYST